MKKLLLLLTLFFGWISNSQINILNDGFESYTDFAKTGIGNWQTLDLDLLTTYTGGLPTGITPTWPNQSSAMAFQVFNPSTTTPQAVTNSTDACNTTAETESRNFDPHTGSKYAACWASVPSTTGGNTANNDFIISPVLNLGGAPNELKFWVKSLSSCYGLEKFRVYVYVGTGTPTMLSDFTLISGALDQTAPLTWQEKTYSLNAYNSQSIRIAVRCLTADAYMFMLDDVTVTTGTLGINDLSKNNYTTFPNPAKDFITVSNDDNVILTDVSITDLNGRIVKSMKVENLSEVQINVSDLNSGVYFMNITSEEGKSVKKFIKN